MTYCNCDPADWIRSVEIRDGVDLSQALRIRYIGSELAAHVSSAATTTDLTFEQGADTAAADVATGDNPGSSGVIDLTTYNTLYKVVREINAAADWEAWLVDVPGDYDPNLSAGNGLFVVAADVDCTGANGGGIFLDTSLKTAEDYYVGITQQGSSANVHPTDHGMLHEVLQIKATATYAAGAESLTVYACDDDLGTKEQIATYTCGATTVLATHPSSGNLSEPLFNVKGKRISILMANDTGAHTAPKLEITRRSMIIHPSIRTSKKYAYTQD